MKKTIVWFFQILAIFLFGWSSQMDVFHKDCKGIPRQMPPNIVCDMECFNTTMYDLWTFYDWGCARGSVQMDPWLRFANQWQLLLAYDVPLNWVVLPATHNSLVSKVNGVGIQDATISDWLFEAGFSTTEVIIENQFISLQDQLEMGLLAPEWDTSWDQDSNSFKICDARFDGMLYQFIETLTHINLPVQAGCGNRNRPISDALVEFKDFFLNKTKNEIFVVMIDSPQFDNHQMELVRELQKLFGDLMYTPLDYLKEFPTSRSQLPTPRHLRALNKRLVITTGQDFGFPANQTLFWKYGPYFANWIEFGPVDLQTPAVGNTHCNFTRGGGNVTQTDMGTIVRVVDGGNIIGPFYNSSEDGGRFSDFLLRETVNCATNYPAIEQASPHMFYSFIWSWKIGQPPPACRSPAAKCPFCVAMDSMDGRWTTVDCAEKLPWACSNQGAALGPKKWVISATGGGCPQGFVVDHPTDALNNQLLQEAALQRGIKYLSLNVDVTQILKT